MEDEEDSAEGETSLLTLELILLDLTWIRVPKTDAEHRLIPTVCFKVLDFPLVMFSPAEPSPQLRPAAGVVYNQGKSCVFSAGMWRLREQFRTYPIYSFLMDTGQQPAPMVAFGAFPLHALLDDITKFRREGGGNWPTISAQHGEAYLRNTRGKRVAWISFALRLSCLSEGAPLTTARVTVTGRAMHAPAAASVLSESGTLFSDMEEDVWEEPQRQRSVVGVRPARPLAFTSAAERGEPGRRGSPAAQTWAARASDALQLHKVPAQESHYPAESHIDKRYLVKFASEQQYTPEMVPERQYPAESHAEPARKPAHKSDDPQPGRVATLDQRWHLEPHHLTPLPCQQRSCGDHAQTPVPAAVSRKVALRPARSAGAAAAAAAHAAAAADDGWSPPRVSRSASSLGAGGGDVAAAGTGSCWQAPLEGSEGSLSDASSGPIVTRLIQELAAMQRAGAQSRDAAVQTRPLSQLLPRNLFPGRPTRSRPARPRRSRVRRAAPKPTKPVVRPLSVISEEPVTEGFARRRVLPFVDPRVQLPDTTAVDRLTRGQPVAVRRAAAAAAGRRMSPAGRLRPVTLTRTAQLRLARHLPDVRHDLQAQEYDRRRDRWLMAQRIKLERAGRRRCLSPHRVGEALRSAEGVLRPTAPLITSDGPRQQRAARSRGRRSARQAPAPTADPPPPAQTSVGVQYDSPAGGDPQPSQPRRVGKRRPSNSARERAVSIDTRSPPSSFSEPRLSLHCRPTSRRQSPLATETVTRAADDGAAEAEKVPVPRSLAAPSPRPLSATAVQQETRGAPNQNQEASPAGNQNQEASPAANQNQEASSAANPNQEASPASEIAPGDGRPAGRFNHRSPQNTEKRQGSSQLRQSPSQSSSGENHLPTNIGGDGSRGSATAIAEVKPVNTVSASSQTTDDKLQPSQGTDAQRSSGGPTDRNVTDESSPPATDRHVTEEVVSASLPPTAADSPPASEVSDRAVSSNTTSAAESVPVEISSKPSKQTSSATSTDETESKSAAASVPTSATTSSDGSSTESDSSQTSTDSDSTSGTSGTLQRSDSELKKKRLSAAPAIVAKHERKSKAAESYYTVAKPRRPPRAAESASTQYSAAVANPSPPVRSRAAPALSSDARRDSGAGVLSRPPTLTKATPATPDPPCGHRSRSHSRDSEEIEARIAMYLEQSRKKTEQKVVVAVAAGGSPAPVSSSTGAGWLKTSPATPARAAAGTGPVAAPSSWLKTSPATPTRAAAGTGPVAAPSWLKAWKVDEEPGGAEAWSRPARGRHTVTAAGNDLNTDSVSSYVPSDMEGLSLSDASPP